MKWLPRSISGQLLALLVLAILVAHAIAVIFLSWLRSDNASIHPMSARTIETRVASAYRAVSHSSRPEPLLADISLPDSSFQIGALPPSTDVEMNPQEQLLAQAIRNQLRLPEDSAILVHLLRVPSAELEQHARFTQSWFEKPFSKNYAWALDIAVEFPDHSWLLSRHWPNMMPHHWNRVLSFSLLVGTLPTIVIAFFFGRRIMRPLQLLTEASKRVSRGESVILPHPRGPDGVREITQAFNDMQRNLVRFVQGRTEMIAAIGHDLRTPLTSLRIRAELIEDEYVRSGIIDTLHEMGVMVEETLEFARNDAYQEPTQNVLLAGLVKEAAEEHRLMGRKITLTDQIPGMWYRCRPVHFKRAIHNLIDNAARYGEVNISMRHRASKNSIEIDIDDHGPGIPADLMEHVFEPFVRLETSRNPSTGGTGLGLAIARSGIRSHGGEVALQNLERGGLRAAIKLPC